MESVTRHPIGFNGHRTSDPEPVLRMLENRKPAPVRNCALVPEPAPYSYDDMRGEIKAAVAKWHREGGARAGRPTAADLSEMERADGIAGLALLVDRHGFDAVARWLRHLAPLHGRSL